VTLDGKGRKGYRVGMQVIIHAGPHKTGTTAIQQFLQRNIDFLSESGVHVPQRLMTSAGHHEVPWALLGWPIKFLVDGIESSSLDRLVERALNDATAAGCSKILFSSEDFSLLNRAQWKDLFATIQSTATQSAPVSVHIVTVYRNPDEYISSQYKTLVQLGLSQELGEVTESLRAHFHEVHQMLQSLPTLFTEVTEVTQLAYRSEGMVSFFCDSLFPGLIFPEANSGEIRVNQSVDNFIIEAIRQGNVNSGVEFDVNHILHWPTFQTANSALTRDERARKLGAALAPMLEERDSLVVERDSLVVERDSLVVERDSLVNSHSWRITKPLRDIVSALRGN